MKPAINACAIAGGEFAVHYYSDETQWPTFPASSWATSEEAEVLRHVSNLLKYEGGRIVVERRQNAEIVDFAIVKQNEPAKHEA